ncbi:ikaros family zinc finger protein-like isoform X1 [Mercenaria mercenaria]|uniref:ikaros family zinc finger protein-like isoform X1 n=1 Tax=Mercenaria mercenaria TaxID=6596 RepID=UPI00234E4C13|nr:ikaros family zinc finger protein-like isoform X1 [Mercenaria mercenaria]
MNMADDVEVMSSEEEEAMESHSDMEVVSASSAISSTDTVIDVVSTGDGCPDIVSSVGAEARCSDIQLEVQQCANSSTSQDVQQCNDCSSSSVQQTPQNLSVAKSASSQNVCDGNVIDASSSEINTINETNGVYHSDNESEIIVDDSPLPGDNTTERVGSSSRSLNEDQDNQICDNGGEISVRYLGRSRSVTPSPSYVRLATPSTPGTPRLRSGSVSGTTYAPLSPKPSPSARATPGERQRAGSMGEIEMRDKLIGREFKHGIRIIDNLDILQLPRPRNPGGILPLNGHNHFSGSNEALNLTVEDRQQTKLSAGSSQSVSSTFSPIVPSDIISTSASKQPNTSYLISNIIRTTPNRLRTSNNATSSFGSLAGRSRGCAINELIERPLPSSIVDSEGVAKKIARLDSEGFMCSSTGDSLWSNTGNADSGNDHLSRVRVISDKTPPERPKPPRRTVLSPADNGSIDMTHDRSFVSSSHGNGSMYPSSPDSEICQLPHHYKCRMCNYSSSSYNLLQLHSTKHGGNGKTFRCSLCDYTTHEKSNFRRHRRLHHKTSPVNVLKCVKCAYVTSLSRKLRDHYQQAHPDMPDLAQSAVIPGLSRNVVSPQRYIGTNGFQPENTSSYTGHIYDNPLMVNRSNRLGFPYSVTGRQPPINFPLNQYGVPYGNYRDRHGENLASNYLRSIVSSIMNSESSRQAATSTVTSSNYYMQPGLDNSHPIQNVHTCNNHGSCPHANCNGLHHEVKIKVEADVDNGCDISSSAQSRSLAMPDITRNLTDNHSHTLSEAVHSNINTITNGITGSSLHLQPITRHRNEEGILSGNHNNDIPTDLTSPRKTRIISDRASTSGTVAHVNVDLENGNDINHDNSVLSPPPSDTIIKSDNTTRGIQCVLPVVKTEIDLDGDYYDFCGRPRFRGIDRAVQCNMSNSNTSTTSSRSQCQTSRSAFRSQSVSESDASEHHSSVCGESRCEYCGISFDDEVLFSIHIGCHSHTDPFKCNVCGKQCGNKYGFYSHIMRGHQL